MNEPKVGEVVKATCELCGNEHACRVPPFYTITEQDVGRSTLRAFGKNWLVRDFMGAIFELDIGKRIYLTSGLLVTGTLEVESESQRKAREG